MGRGAIRGVVALSGALAVLAGVGLAAGDCPAGAVAQDSTTVETELGSFLIEVCVVHHLVAAEHEYTITVTNVDLECPIQSFGLRPLLGAEVELEPSPMWQPVNEAPEWWMWDGPSWQAIGEGSSREFSFRVPDSTPVAGLSGVVFTVPASPCGKNQLRFHTLGASEAQGSGEGEESGGFAATSESETGDLSHGQALGRLCACEGSKDWFQAAQRISVPRGFRAEYFVSPTGLSDPNDVLIRGDGSILIVSARMEAIQEVELNGTIKRLATMAGYDIEIDGAGNLYGYNIVNGEVYAFDAAMSPHVIAELPGTVFGSPLAVTPSGTLFIAHNATRSTGPGVTTLYRIRMEEPTPVAVATLPEFVTALASDAGGGLLAVTNHGQWLSRIDPDGGRIEHLVRLGVEDVGYHGLAVDSDGTAYVATDEGSFVGAVLRVRPTGSVEEVARFENGRIEGLALREDGSLVAVQALAGALYVIETDGSVNPVIPPNGLVTPHSIAFSPCGDLVVVADEAGRLLIVCPDGDVKPFAEAITFQAPQTFLAFTESGECVVGESAPGFPSRVSIYTLSGERSTFAAGLDLASGVAVGPDGSIYVAETGGGRILRFGPDGSEEVFADDLATPQALCITPEGTLYVVVGNAWEQEVPAVGDSVAKINRSGTVSFVTEALGAAALAIGPDGSVYVAAGGRVLRIEPTGAVGTFASGFESARGLAFDSEGNLYVADDTEGFIVRIVRIDGAPEDEDGDDSSEAVKRGGIPVP